MQLTVPVTYPGLFEFLEDYRQNLRHLNFTADVSSPVKIGDYVQLQVGVPVMNETVAVLGRVMAPMGDKAGLQLESGDAGLAQLEGFYRFIGSLVEEMLRSGRFRIAGVWAGGQGAARSAGAVAGPSATTTVRGSAFPDPASFGNPKETGPINADALGALLMSIYRAGADAVVEFRTEQGRRLGYFKKGGLVQYLSDPVIEEECLGMLLARAGRLTKEQLRESLDRMNSTGQQQGQCLIEMGALTFPQLVVSLMTQVEIVTRNLVAANEGTWSLWDLPRFEANIVTPPMKAPGFLFGYYRKHFASAPAKAMEDEQAPLMDRYAVLAKDLNWDDLRMKKEEQRLIEILGARSYRYREIFSVSSLGRAATIQVLLSLVRMGLLQFTDAEDVAQVEGRWRAALERKLGFMREQNPFELLEVHWTSGTSQVEAAHKRMKAEYETFGGGQTLPADVEAMRREVLDMIEGAYRLLANTQIRSETRRKHYEQQQMAFSADLLARQAEMLMVRQRWEDATDNLMRATELMPNEGKYKAFLRAAQERRGGSLGEIGGDDD